MSSRSVILSKIKANKPPFLELPIIDLDLFLEDLNLLDRFKKMVEAVGGNVLETTSNSDLISQINNLFPDSRINYSTLEDFEVFNTIELDNIKDPRELEDIDIFVLEGLFGVAENGSVWIPDNQIPIRILPFICKHLIIVIDSSKIFQDMHQVYEQIEDFDFGVFISGPSKTADIEQSLVLGAQGALSLTVFIK